MQCQEADDVLDMIDADGSLAGLDHLKSWDFSDETTSATIKTGYVYNVPPSGQLEREVRYGDYYFAYSHSFEHVGLMHV